MAREQSWSILPDYQRDVLPSLIKKLSNSKTKIVVWRTSKLPG